MSDFDFFGGIDFSGAKEPLSNLWSALGVERGGKLRIVAIRPHAFRSDLAGYVAGGWRTGLEGGGGRLLWGADFPFGLPKSATDRLAAGEDWSSIIAWVADRPADEIRALAAEAAREPRLTDTGGALSPLDLRLYKQTVEGLRWLHELREEYEIAVLPQAPQPSSAVTLIEVYPSAAAQELGLPRRRAPGRPGEVRARAAALRTFVEFADPTCESLAVTLEDAWDATVACLTAFLCRDDLDQPARLGSGTANRARSEGWIYRPPATLPEPSAPFAGGSARSSASRARSNT